jgi:hypothetical protein
MNPVIGLSLGRVAVGVVAVANPDVITRTFQLDTQSSPQLAYLTRLFGAREAALGVATLVTTGRTRKALTGIGILVDATDAGIGYLSMRDGVISQRGAAALIGPAVGAVGSGLMGLLRRG